MPIYEYECKKCNHTLDILQKMSDPPALQCPQCGEDSLVRLVSAAGFQLKGTGWYVTDFRDKHKAKETSSTHTDTVSPTKDASQDSSLTKASSTESTTPTVPSTAKTTSDKSQASVQSKTGTSSQKKNSEKS